MNATTPRFAGLRLLVAAEALRLTPLPKLLARLIVDRKLATIDFAAEGNPPPFYVPAPYRPGPR